VGPPPGKELAPSFPEGSLLGFWDLAEPGKEAEFTDN